MTAGRLQWPSRPGFILAAAGAALGIGNLVYSGACAYQYGAGTFFLTYLIALCFMGIPIMALELGLGSITGKPFPAALYQAAGKAGEFWGWFSLCCTAVMILYSMTLLAWCLGMLWGILGPSLWPLQSLAPVFPGAAGLSPVKVYFFEMITQPVSLLFLGLIWLLNLWVLARGIGMIERFNRILLPLMGLILGVLLIRGLTLPHGWEGLMLLLTPNWQLLFNPAVWKAALTQAFLTLALGFGVMTAYASYLSVDADQFANALIITMTSALAGVFSGAVLFSLFFSFALLPQVHTLSMGFLAIPEALFRLPGGPPSLRLYGGLFFLLLLMAGLTSSISLLEGLALALSYKFGHQRRTLVIAFALLGGGGSVMLAFPGGVNSALFSQSTLSWTLMQWLEHWVLGYGLFLVGLMECLLVGWFWGAERLRQILNQSAQIPLPAFFVPLVKGVIPALLLLILGASLLQEWQGLFGQRLTIQGFQPGLPWLCLLLLILGIPLLALFLTLAQPAGHAQMPDGEELRL